MVRIGGSTDRGEHIKEHDYYTPQGEFRIDKDGSPTLLNCLMYKMCYYRFGSVYTEAGEYYRYKLNFWLDLLNLLCPQFGDFAYINLVTTSLLVYRNIYLVFRHIPDCLGNICVCDCYLNQKKIISDQMDHYHLSTDNLNVLLNIIG